MSSNNSIPALFRAREVEEQSVTQFPAEGQWYHLVDGLIIQGGKVNVGANATQTVSFVTSFPKETLGVFLSSTGRVDNVDLEQFDIINDATAKDFYWWAIGV